MIALIFDTETIGKVSQDLLNVGYKIVDINIQLATINKVYIERDYLVSDLYANEIYCKNDDFVGVEKYEKYRQLVENKLIVKHKLPKIMELMQKDIEKFKPLFCYAYNCNFDIDKFKKSCEKYQCVNPLATMTTFDIWAYASQYIVQTEDYKQWAKVNEQFTASEVYISTSVETVIKYLTNNLDFVEDHTALSDVQYETMILCECVKRGADITRECKLNRFVKSMKLFEIELVFNGQTHKVQYTKKYERGNKIKFTNELETPTPAPQDQQELELVVEPSPQD